MTRSATRKLESGARLALRGLFLNLALSVVKIGGGLLGRSYALIADGVESLLDVVSSLLMWVGLKYAARPPDASHPYGHGKAEPVAAIVGSAMILLAAAGLSVESIQALHFPRLAPSLYTLPLLLVVIGVKEWHSRRVSKAAGETGSLAVAADAVHHRGDAITSASAFIGISIAALGGKRFESADNWAALFACGVIAYNGIRFVWPAMSDLMDAAPPGETTEHVRAISASVPGVVSVHYCRVRKMGVEYYVDLHVSVDASISVRAGHEIAHRVKDAVRGSLPDVADVLVHIEPAQEGMGDV